MGGTIGVTSTPGQGATFTVDLPFAAVAAPPEAAEVPPVAPLRLLVVEDEPVNRRVLYGLLQRDGHAVRAVATAHEALALLETEREAVDLVLTDLRLPGLSGLDLARRLGEAGGPPVIAVTANLMPEDRAACAEAGVRAVVGKPVLPAALRAALAAADVVRPAPEPPAVTTETAVFDPAYLEELAAALPADEVARLIGLAETSLREGLERLRTAEDPGDAAHRLAGVAGSYGLSRLREACKVLEATGQGDVASIAGQVAQGIAALAVWRTAVSGRAVSGDAPPDRG
jgi:CheY-like chemotaxis protein/HPt (histidine-containing phosphotransfer) domain-containing protein